MKTILKLVFTALFIGLATAAEWPPVIPWTIETRDPAAQNLRLLRNETVQLRPQFLNGDAAVSIPTNATFTFRYRDASISTGAYHVATGTVYNATNGQVNLLWLPAYCGTLTNYAYNILVASNTVVCYRGFGALRFQGVVDGTVTTNPAGRIAIDWSTVDNSNTDSAPFAKSVSGISSAQCVSIVGGILPTSSVAYATSAGTAVDATARSNAATAQARADLSVTNAGATVNGQSISNGAAIVIDTGVSTATATSIAENVVGATLPTSSVLYATSAGTATDPTARTAASNAQTTADGAVSRFGANAGLLATGSFNTYMGTSSGSGASGDKNFFGGYYAGPNCAVSWGVILGYLAAEQATGDKSVFAGYAAGRYSSTTGSLFL